MTVKSRNYCTSKYSLETKLEAVRQRIFGELSYQAILDLYGISSGTLSSWLHKFRSEVLRREGSKGIPLYVFQPEDDMPTNDQAELERLRREVEDLKLINETWEIIARLAKERYSIDIKKNFGALPSAKPATPEGKPKEGNG